MKLSPSLLGSAAASLLFGLTASAKDLSIGMVNDDWKIEKECSVALDKVQAALLTHVAGTIMPDDNDGHQSKTHLSSFHNCPKICNDISDSLCKRITRGYCSGNNNDRAVATTEAETTTARPPLDPLDDDVMPPADFDVTTLNCDKYCQDIPSWLCRRITYEHCAGNSSNPDHDSKVLLSTTDAKVAPPSPPPPPYHCPTFCQDVPAWICARISKGSCTGSSAERQGPTAEMSAPYECSTICKNLPNWVCRRVSRGYCTGIYDESSVHDGRVTVAAVAPHSATTAVATADPNPFHCVSYCADLPSWLCQRVTAGQCTGNERRGLTDADTFDELVMVTPNLPVPHRRQLNVDCETLCRCVALATCKRMSNGYCVERNPSRGGPERTCPGEKPAPAPFRSGGYNYPIPTRCPPVRSPSVYIGGNLKDPCVWAAWLRAQQPVRARHALAADNDEHDMVDPPLPSSNTDGGGDGGGSTAIIVDQQPAAARKDDVTEEADEKPPLGVVVPVLPANVVVGGHDVKQVLPPPPPPLVMSYHCPTYCRRVPPSLCARLTYGYCGVDSTNTTTVEGHVHGADTTIMTATTATGHTLRGSSTNAHPVSGDDDDDCDMAIAAMAAKFGELVDDLVDDQDCAVAIMKANVMFKCSPTTAAVTKEAL
jgi:hypothetical protein